MQENRAFMIKNNLLEYEFKFITTLTNEDKELAFNYYHKLLVHGAFT